MQIAGYFWPNGDSISWACRCRRVVAAPVGGTRGGTVRVRHDGGRAPRDERRCRRGPLWRWAAGDITAGAFEHGHLVGTATFVRESEIKSRHKGHLYGVYVAAAHRGKGIARTVITRLLDAARADPGIEQILLTVAAGAGRSPLPVTWVRGVRDRAARTQGGVVVCRRAHDAPALAVTSSSGGGWAYGRGR